MTSRELVRDTLEFRNPSGRVPRQLWTLPCAVSRYPETAALLAERYPDDVINAPNPLKTPLPEKGDPFAVGRFIDAFGCTVENLQYGVVGEVKTPLVTGEDWTDLSRVHVPTEYFSLDADAVNRFCAGTDKWVNMGACPRPFERLQFLRGTEDLYCDLLDPPEGFREFLKTFHEFNCGVIGTWAKRTDVDAVLFMDDWGSRRSLLISPELWREYFRPMYRDFCQIAHAYGKKAFMHSDGQILELMPDFVEMGLDALNLQISVIGAENLVPFAGKITFWGELDGQWILPFGTPEDVDRAVDETYELLWRDGGCIAECEFGVGSRPENVLECFRRWDEKNGKKKR